MKLALFTGLALAALASIATSASQGVTPAGRLRLLDGRTLENTVVRSYDEQSSKVLVISNGTARLIPITLIPPPFAERIKAAYRHPRADLVQTTQPRLSTTSGNPSGSSVSTPAPSPSPSPAAATVIVKADDPRSQHRDAAKAHAYRYFKYVFRTGSNAVAVTDSDIEIDDTESIPGWNQYRTKGKAYLEVYDSVGGGSFSRRARAFEVVTEQKPGEEIKVIDFTRK
jgi:hypothetical protein